MLMQKSGFEQVIVNEALRDALSNIRQRIKIICAPAESKANENPEQANKIALQLLKEAKPLLSIVDQLLPSDDLIRRGAHDEVATKMLHCQIAYANKTQDWKGSLELLEGILPLAAGELIISRIKENLEIVKKNREAGLCFFCGRNEPDEQASIEVAMYGNVKHIPNIPGLERFNRPDLLAALGDLGGRYGTKVTWQQANIKVPRCSSCKAYHTRSKTKRSTYHNSGSDIKRNWSTAFGVIGGVIGLFLVRFSFLWVIALPLLGVYIARKVIKVKIAGDITPCKVEEAVHCNIRSLNDKIEFPPIKQLRAQGWNFGSRPPNVY
jgi:hypothetical protein